MSQNRIKPETGRSVHFLPRVLLVLALIVAAFAVLFLTLGHYTDEDVASYRSMITNATSEGPSQRAVTSEHLRKNLQKDVYISRNSSQFQFRLRSKDAHLALERIKGKTDIVETMQDVECWLQEDFLYRFPNGSVITSQDPLWSVLVPVAIAIHATPQQRVVYLEANTATYDYNGETFDANNAKIWRYMVPSHKFTELVDKQKALISGIAEHVVISFGSEGLTFNAEGFKAAISIKGGGR